MRENKDQNLRISQAGFAIIQAFDRGNASSDRNEGLTEGFENHRILETTQSLVRHTVNPIQIAMASACNLSIAP